MNTLNNVMSYTNTMTNTASDETSEEQSFDFMDLLQDMAGDFYGASLINPPVEIDSNIIQDNNNTLSVNDDNGLSLSDDLQTFAAYQNEIATALPQEEPLAVHSLSAEEVVNLTANDAPKLNAALSDEQSHIDATDTHAEPLNPSESTNTRVTTGIEIMATPSQVSTTEITSPSLVKMNKPQSLLPESNNPISNAIQSENSKDLINNEEINPSNHPMDINVRMNQRIDATPQQLSTTSAITTLASFNSPPLMQQSINAIISEDTINTEKGSSTAELTSEDVPMDHVPVTLTSTAQSVTTQGVSEQKQIAEAITQPVWHDRFTTTLQQAASQGVDQVKIQLHPQELGPINAEISVKDGLTHIHLINHDSQVNQLMHEAIPKLQQLFQDADLKIGNVTIEQNFVNQDQQSSHYEQKQSSAATNHQSTETNNESEPETQEPLNKTITTERLIDYYA